MSAKKPLVLMMAGGTGGHVYPALAVALALRDRDYQVEWVGTSRGLEARVVPGADIKLHCLAVRGVRGKNPLWKLIALVSLMVASIQALWLVMRLSPKCVVGLGGYVAGPAGIAAWILRRPLLIHEQNGVAGTTNRMLAPFATKILGGFPGAFPTDIDYEVVGNPVRKELIEKGPLHIFSYQGQRPLRLLVLGGSLGAKPINDVLPAVVAGLIAQLGNDSIRVRHQCGETHAEAVRGAYGTSSSHTVEVLPFIEDMADAYSWSDLVLCRAGALTVSELAVMGCASILVPLPHAIDDHQSFNARSLSDTGAAILLCQTDMSCAELTKILTDFIADPECLAAMARAAAAAAIPDATERVCRACEDLIHVR